MESPLYAPGPKNWTQSGYASSAPATTAATASPAANGRAAERSAGRPRASASTTTPSPMAVISRISRLRNACQTITRPSRTPLRSHRPGSARRSVRQMISGTTNWLTMLGCELACEIIAGANAQKAAPSHAGPRDFTTTRESRKYQDTPVAASPRVRKIRKDQRGPAQSVIGVSGNETDNTDVLAMRLTTSGTFIRSEVNG